MLDCSLFFDQLTEQGIDFFAGVPDSLLKDICACITDRAPTDRHIIAPNEGNAVALAAGHHLATGKSALVYLQNSGLGNAINPLTSLTDPEVYAIPLLLLIGWRGEPGVKDEPQHIKMGRVTPALLEALEIPFSVLPAEWDEANEVLRDTVRSMQRSSAPHALLVRAGTFAPYELRRSMHEVSNDLSREEAIGRVVAALPSNAVVVSTTGKISRELYAWRTRNQEDRSRDFLVVGSMGHASQIALAIAAARPDSPVFCFDGDGAVLMHMGSLASAGALRLPNFRHIVFNNWSHESVGGQPSIADEIDLPLLATSCGYDSARRAVDSASLDSELATFIETAGPAFLEVLVRKGSRADLERPRERPIENKLALMKGFGLR